jgi:hypothetical protein
MNWGASADTGGGTVTYHWRLSSGESGSTTSTSASVGGKGAGSYSFTVYASNPGGSSGTTTSNTVTVANPPSSGTVYDGGPQNNNPTYRNHYLGLNYTNLPAGTYTVNLYDDTQAGVVMSGTITVAGGSGSVVTSLYGYYTNVNSRGWFRIEVVGQFMTPQWTPTWATPAS